LKYFRYHYKKEFQFMNKEVNHTRLKMHYKNSKVFIQYLLWFTAMVLAPVQLISQNTYKEPERVINYFTGASQIGLATPDPQARIAISADGNYGDADDWGATPLTLSMIYHVGYKDLLVHYDYCSKTMNNPWLERYMELATLEGAKRFAYDKSRFFNTQRDPDGAANNLAEQINASTAENKLVVLLAGSPGILWQAVNRSKPEKRKHVYVISHGPFETTNNNDLRRRWGPSAVDVIALGVNWVQISDQNKGKRTAEAGFATGTMDTWEFIKNTWNGQWVYDWIDRVDSDEGVTTWGYRGATGDASDAGLAFYYFTGDEDGNVAKLKDFYTQIGNNSLPSPQK
jgi:hypothetical protein